MERRDGLEMEREANEQKLRQVLMEEVLTMDWAIEELGGDWRLKEDAPTLSELRAGLMERLEELEALERA